jgi:membrane-bound lytic murein transglycosylase B
MNQFDSLKTFSRRALLRTGVSAAAVLVTPMAAFAVAPPGFDQWRDSFRARALAKGISEATWTRVMGRIEPDMSVFRQMQKQPEFNEQIWQYINRRVSDWRIINGREALKKNEALFARIEQDFGVERGTLLALWGVESAYGDPLVQQNHMRPVFPSLAADQRVEDRRPRLGHAGGNARILGRRHGPYPVDAGSLAQCRHGLRQGRPRLAVRQA